MENLDKHLIVPGKTFFVPCGSLVAQESERSVRDVDQDHKNFLKRNFLQRLDMKIMPPLLVETDQAEIPAAILEDEEKLQNWLSGHKFATIAGNHRRVAFQEIKAMPESEVPERVRKALDKIPCYIYHGLSWKEARKLARRDNEEASKQKKMDFYDELWGLRKFFLNLCKEKSMDPDSVHASESVWTTNARTEWIQEINSARLTPVGMHYGRNWVPISVWKSETFELLLKCVKKYNWKSPNSLRPFVGLSFEERHDLLQQLFEERISISEAKHVRIV